MKRKIHLVHRTAPSLRIKAAFTYATGAMTIVGILTWLTFTYGSFQPVGDAMALSTEMSGFTIQESYEGVTISWKTASSENGKDFVVEQSLDGVNFDPIATLNCKNSSGVSYYEYLDEYPLLGRTYYRITYIDLEGNAESFKSQMVEYTLDWPEMLSQLFCKHIYNA